MAIKTSKAAAEAAKRYLKFINGRTITLTVVSQILILLVIGFMGVFWTNLDELTWVTIWVGLAVVYLFVLLMYLLINIVFVKPAHDLTQLIYDLAEDNGKLARMPESRLLEYKKNGLDSMAEYLYGLKTTNASLRQQIKQDVVQAPDFLFKALDYINVGIIIANPEGQVIYHNKKAPIEDGAEDLGDLKLRFEKNDGIETWLKETLRDEKISAERTWERVTSPSEEEGENNYYNVVGYFHRGAEAETIIVAIDQTLYYSPDEEDLSFIAFAAHELRGPITVIRGYLDVLHDEVGPELDTEYQELLDRLVVSANRLSGYINNILNVSRYDQRHMQLVLTEETVGDMFDGIMDDISLRASSRQRLLALDIPDGLPTVAADISSMSEVFTNLVDNAIKYSYEGGLIEVQAKENGNFVDISVVDHGIGMPPNVVANLFKKFYRSHRSRESIAGTGIGLYISKAIVDSHGGNITVRSREGEGSTFTISLPTYASVKDKLDLSKGGNAGIITQHRGGWIKNHGTTRR